MRDWKVHLRSALESGDPDRIRRAAEVALEQTPDHFYTRYSSWEVQNQIRFLVGGRLDELEFSVDENDDDFRQLIEKDVRERFSDRVYNALVSDPSFWSAVNLEIQTCDPDPFMGAMDDAVTTVAEPTIEEMFEDEAVLIEVLAYVKRSVEDASAAVNPCVEVTR